VTVCHSAVYKINGFRCASSKSYWIKMPGFFKDDFLAYLITNSHSTFICLIAMFPEMPDIFVKDFF
jgi:hypothetical protein